jgi:uncharacterized protein (AIM24 family)
MQDRVVEAKEALEQALTHQPQDEKSQDLLAGVYFRLGVYPRAIEIWGHLVDAYPDDPTLRVNLGLALFKTGQHDAALAHIHAALRIQPEHEKAWGYLGLIHWRRGQLEEARDAFLRGGQATMARRMEESLGRSNAAPAPAMDGAGGDAVAPVVREPAEEERGVRSAADEAMARFEAEEVPLEVEASAASVAASAGPWQTRAPGEEPLPLVHRRVHRTAAAAPDGLASLLGSWVGTVPEGASLAVAGSGHLLVRAVGTVCCRLDGLAATQGSFRTTVVRRQVRGRELEEILGGDSPLMRWHGPVGGLLVPPEGRRFVAFRLAHDDTLHVREASLFAFDEGVSWETGRLPSAGGDPVVVTQLSGGGAVVLWLDTAPTAVAVREGEETRVDPARVLGWTGRLLPTTARGTLPYAATAPPLAFRGEGMVLLR